MATSLQAPRWIQKSLTHQSLTSTFAVTLAFRYMFGPFIYSVIRKRIVVAEELETITAVVKVRVQFTLVSSGLILVLQRSSTIYIIVLVFKLSVKGTINVMAVFWTIGQNWSSAEMH